MELENFLNNKPLYYDVIDYTRMPRVYARIQNALKIPKIIHLIGTNGKGTTGRFLASALLSLGYRVGHYTSPHILEFNERIWINGQNISNTSLNAAHQKLQTILTNEESDALSYFEYTTLLAMLLFEDLEYVILEAGLGGEFDATAVFPKVLTLVTPIDKDHEAFLGDTVAAIATTKLNAVQNAAILAKQKHEIVYEVAARLSDKDIYKTQDLLTMADYKKIQDISYMLALAPYLEENLKLSIAALKYFDIAYEASDFKDAKLFGRLSQIEKNILLDVGHNALAAASIAEALQGKKYTLIYNSYKDKDYKTILQTLKPIIESVELLAVDEARIESTQLMQAALDALGIKHKAFVQIEEEKNYLVFGSFSVAQKFLQTYKK
ncbi:MAG: bifunctional folylpolyglutamate synthase/dihydrofolate synthase [Sulfurimonas sp.]|nr:bifunctional folylpolyglutamate synthase/dihydrofolate synthase [Sulfurimonas sp.]